MNRSTLSRANEGRDCRIFSDFGSCLIGKVRPLYSKEQLAGVDIDSDVFALDSTTISLSLKLFSWAPGKYSRGAIKVHTLMDIRGSIPAFILITDGKYHDSNVLDSMVSTPGAIYMMDKAYIDFAALQNINNCGAYFISRAKSTMDFTVVENNFQYLKWYRSERRYPDGKGKILNYRSERSIRLAPSPYYEIINE